MSATFDALLESWPSRPWLCALLIVTGLVFVRGWLMLHRRNESRWSGRKPAAFSAALIVLFLALGSPLDSVAPLSLQAHMLQHMLLMMVAAPLVWLAAPLAPLVRGLPRWLRVLVSPLLGSPELRAFLRGLVHPAAALPIMVAANWLWHIPAAYELALRSPQWHRLEHATFFLAALMFWHPVVRPYPSRPRWSRWLLLPYLLLADVQNTLLAALLTFSNRVLYPHYAALRPLGGGTALEDQAAAGVLMWVPGSIAFLLPLAWIGFDLLAGGSNRARAIAVSRPKPGGILMNSASQRWQRGVRANSARQRLDLLRLPLVGRFLRWRRARLVMQLSALALAVVIAVDGICGPQASPMNLAGVLPWIHWRAIVVFGLVAIGNVSCMACPFTLPRSLARRWLPSGRSWPARLRSKWLAVALVLLFFWGYEQFSLWDRPWWTAWLVVGYFAAALLVDAIFSGAAFCKYVCPVGQFNFVQALVSPWQVSVREPAVCTSCRTHDCLHGRGPLRGCELELFQPRKASNLDCTFCMNCVHACPHGNIGIVAESPLVQLASITPRAAARPFTIRADVATLVALLSFGAFANAAGMVAPVMEWRERVAAAVNPVPASIADGILLLLAWIVLPAVGIAGASELSRRLGRLSSGRVALASRYVYALLPLGLAMWMAHYGFHFFTSYAAALPAAQRFAADWGLVASTAPNWACSCCAPAADWLLKAELMVLDLGLLGSLVTTYRLARADMQKPAKAMLLALPWVAVLLVMFAAGVWIVLQPMQMRGTFS